MDIWYASHSANWDLADPNKYRLETWALWGPLAIAALVGLLTVLGAL